MPFQPVSQDFLRIPNDSGKRAPPEVVAARHHSLAMETPPSQPLAASPTPPDDQFTAGSSLQDALRNREPEKLARVKFGKQNASSTQAMGRVRRQVCEVWLCDHSSWPKQSGEKRVFLSPVRSKVQVGHAGGFQEDGEWDAWTDGAC